MAPQESIPTSATVLGAIGTVLWCIQLLPQIWHSYRTKSTKGLPEAMMFLWSLSSLPFGVYSITQRFNVGLQIQPQLFGLFCGVSWGQCLYYGRRWKAWKCILAVTVLLTFVAALQIVFVFVIRGPYSRGVSWPVMTFGIIACITLLSGYAPIPFELMKRRGRVVGIDFWFLLVDSSGALFSLLSLVFQNTFDIEFGTLYAVCCTVEYGVFISHGVWLLRTRELRRRAKAFGQSFDDLPEARAWQEGGFKLEEWMGRCCFGRSKRDQVLDEELAVADEQSMERDTVA
ncbi:uncharacterized protein LTR77_002209 [Saxophila tyrrhenica]|uniref:PQ loop repeat protein n=1 Tax=Saxophila tyrrhenica TaxID=1690608 RepID=A0AAV9PMJ1_9PEZI|nr:hypothetical protein LTR77_002209 [Saxophila tyrrhenica]